MQADLWRELPKWLSGFCPGKKSCTTHESLLKFSRYNLNIPTLPTSSAKILLRGSGAVYGLIPAPVSDWQGLFSVNVSGESKEIAGYVMV